MATHVIQLDLYENIRLVTVPQFSNQFLPAQYKINRIETHDPQYVTFLIFIKSSLLTIEGIGTGINIFIVEADCVDISLFLPTLHIVSGYMLTSTYFC